MNRLGSANRIPFLTTLKNVNAENMAVNGSVTPVTYMFAPSEGIYFLADISLMISDGSSHNPSEFGDLNTPLQNGLDIVIKTEGVVKTIANLKHNIHIQSMFDRNPGRFSYVSGLSNIETYMGTMPIAEHGLEGPILSAAHNDYIGIVVRDNLTNLDLLGAKVKLYQYI